MDNNFSDILNIFKRLDEGNEGNFGKPATIDQPSPAAAAQAKAIVQKAADNRAISLANIARVVPDEKNINADVEEDSMADAEHHASGSKFGGYWKGTDKGTPKPGQGVGGCAEDASLEEELMNEWSKYVEENIVPTGATGATGTTGNPVDAAKMNKEVQNAQQNINKLKSAGVNMTTSPSQAAQSAVKMANNPQANPATGQGMDQAAKKTTGALGKSIEDLITTGNPAQVTQVANAIKQAKLGQK